MNFLRRSWLFLTIGTLTMLSSCQRNTDALLSGTNNTTGIVVNSSPVNASVQGKVIDQNNNPVPGGTVKAGGNVTITDSRGLFRFNRINIDQYASVVTVEANGYFKGIRTFSAKDGSSNFVKLKLLTKNLAGSIDAATGGTVTLSDNSQVIFSASSVVVKSTGVAYTGPVRVYAASIDPTAVDIAETVPGSFQATDSNNYRVILKSFGMVAVVLEGSTGEQLQIATGKTATLHVTIPAALAATAPANLPLWYMDETTGLWKQEGNAIKTGNAYEGTVSHFSFWNCDAGANTVFFEVTVVTANGPLPNAMVKLTRLNNGGASYGFTDSLGHVGGMVFMNEQLELDVLDNCYQVVYTQTVGPFTQNTNIGTITVPISQINLLDITGNAVDCSNQPVTSGNAMIYFEGQLYMMPIVNGQFDATILRCANSNEPVEIVVIDNVNYQQSSNWTGTASTGTLNVGTLTACGISTDQYINYVLDGVNYSITSANPGDSLTIDNNGQTSNLFYAWSSILSNTHVYMNWVGNTIGSFPLTVNAVNGYANIAAVPPCLVNITAYGAPGQFVEGNFNATFIEIATSVTHTFSGTFKVRRY